MEKENVCGTKKKNSLLNKNEKKMKVQTPYVCLDPRGKEKESSGKNAGKKVKRVIVIAIPQTGLGAWC